MKTLIKSFLAIAGLMVVFAAGAQAQEKTKLRFSESTFGFSFLQSNLPAVMGYFDQENIEADYIRSAAAATGVSALLGGDVDVYVGSTGALMKAQSRGADIVAIAALTTQFVSGIVVSRAWADKNGLTAKSPLDAKLKALKGRDDRRHRNGLGFGSDRALLRDVGRLEPGSRSQDHLPGQSGQTSISPLSSRARSTASRCRRRPPIRRSRSSTR